MCNDAIHLYKCMLFNSECKRHHTRTTTSRWLGSLIPSANLPLVDWAPIMDGVNGLPNVWVPNLRRGHRCLATCSMLDEGVACSNRACNPAKQDLGYFPIVPQCIWLAKPDLGNHFRSVPQCIWFASLLHLEKGIGQYRCEHAPCMYITHLHAGSWNVEGQQQNKKLGGRSFQIGNMWLWVNTLYLSWT